MLIRSQDKKLIINLDNIESISICGYKVNSKSVYEADENADTWYVSCTSQDYSPFVGHYSTESKAVKVLDMIQGHSDRHKYDMELSDTFQMPQDTEVMK